MSCDPMLLWLWQRPASAAPIKPLDYKIPYDTGKDVKKKKKKKSVEREKN